MNTNKNIITKEMFDDYKKEQNNKLRRAILFMVVLSLVISGISGVASYTYAANNIAYTPRDTSWNVENTEQAINELREGVGTALVGSIFSYMGNYVPVGYLACDGTEYNIADYPRLASHISYNFGSYNYFGGNGTTTFKVPDLRGEFLRGSGTNGHSAQGNGSTVGTHQNATIHVAVGASDSTYISIAKGQSLWDGFQNADYTPARNALNRYINTSGENSNKRIPYYTSRPTNTSVLYIIKY